MPRCEDFPCCGHEANDCPDSEGRFRCVDCGGTNWLELSHNIPRGRGGSDTE